MCVIFNVVVCGAVPLALHKRWRVFFALCLVVCDVVKILCSFLHMTLLSSILFGTFGILFFEFVSVVVWFS